MTAIRLIDGTKKQIPIDNTLIVEDIIRVIANKVGISTFEEYGLLVEGNTNYLKNPQTLQEQYVKDNDVLEFKKRFFVDDVNVDKSDPVQLHLIYSQSRDAILKGVYPCTLEEATTFASIQLQIETGNYNAQKHVTGWLKKATYLPQAHHKKAVEKVIFKEWEKLVGTPEINAKFRYIQFVRQLATYGITSFDCEEKIQKKRKLQQVLIGITRDSVLRMDPESKKILQTWAISKIKRWAAYKNSFTLDFGTHENDFYSVQTKFGEEMSQLLSGYIDILLRRQKEGILKIEEVPDMIAEVQAIEIILSVANVSTVSNIGVGNYTPEDLRKYTMHPSLHQYTLGTTDNPQKYDLSTVSQMATLLGKKKISFYFNNIDQMCFKKKLLLLWNLSTLNQLKILLLHIHLYSKSKMRCFPRLINVEKMSWI